MKKLCFALFGNIYQAKKAHAVQKLLCLLEEHDADLLIDENFYRYLTEDLQIDPRPTGLIRGNDFRADIVVSMGGDGTFLEAASRVGDKRIPILGINTGRLGFLADVTADEIDAAISAIYRDDYQVEERSVLHLTYDTGKPQGYPYALNEIAVLKRDNSSMISIRVNIDGEYLTTYQADGLIVNTPTGSTGYALSVGGPIMSPTSHAIGIVPVAPHSLNIRPIAIRDGAMIELAVESRSHQILVSLDGRSETCNESVKLHIRKAPYTIRIIKRAGCSFFKTLRNKLMWGNDLREC